MMIAVSLLAVASVVAVALAARQRTRSEFHHFQELEKMSASADTGIDAQRISALLAGRCCDADTLQSATAALSPHQVLIVVDSSGRVIAKSGKPLDAMKNFQFSRNGGMVSIQAIPQNEGGDVRGITLQLRISGISIGLRNGTRADLFVFPMPDQDSQAPEAVFLGSVDRSLVLATLLIATCALLATWTLTGRITGPIDELREAARDVAGGNLARRVDTSGSDEIAELSRSFNAMAAELERVQVLRRNLVDDVIHELRTPLTALRCHIDSIADGVSKDPQKEIAGANEEIDHLLRLVEDLHELALAEARELTFTISEASLGPIIASAARAASLENDPRLRVELENGIVVRADAVRLRQVVLNILNNAARYTPRDGRITVNAFHRDKETVVEIHNTGSNLTTEEAAHVFDRFYRADPSRQRASGGTGLGLSIVKNLIEAQGGRVWSLSDDSGVSFAFALPSHTWLPSPRGSTMSPKCGWST
jgi:signal transduction histidine kinase